MREKKFGKLFLTWLLAATMVLTLLPVSMLAADDADDGEAVLTPVAGAEAGETAVPAEAVPMLLATPAAADTPIAVPTDKLFFDKANGVITGIDADWLAENKDKPLSVTIPAVINGTPVTSIGQNAFNGKKVVAVDFSNATNLEKIDNQAFMHSPVASVDLSNTQVTVIGKFAFGDCKSLETFIFSNTLTSLGNSDGASVFTDCRSLKVMRLAGSPEGVVFELPEGLTTIGYVYFEYYWFDEVSLGDGKNTLNGPRSTEEQKRFSAATSNVEIQYVDGKHNTIPIAKTEHARYEGSSYEGYNDYYLVVVFGYHVVNGKKADTPFYLSANNGIGVGNANATHGPHLLQVKVDEVRVITATADEHGKIAPAAGTITVPKGKSETFTITPDSGYHIKDVLVDGKSVGAVGTYTFENVVDNHTIHATFARKHTPTPSTPTVEIPDDDALGLNTTDHFAYIVGYGNGEVRPQNNITRAEVATIFFRLLTDDVRDENLTKTNRYSDVAATSWYNTAVSTLSSMGIITGYPDGTFRPNAAITRAEFAAIAARFDNDGDKTAAKFSDIAIHWAKDEISIAYNNGWITGYPDGTFGPQRDITRAETMTLVNRVLNRQPETEDDLLPNMTVWTDNANPKAWYYLAVQEATNSHYYEFKTNSQYEKWTELRETRDWKALEQ